MTNLFCPFDLSGIELSNRIVMAPMTRVRAPDDIANAGIALHYTQRATAGLIVTEGTPISREGQGYIFNPGIYTPAQIEGWKLTTDSVHSVGGRIYAQIWHVGRLSHPSIQDKGISPVSATSKQARASQAFGYDAQGKPARLHSPAPRRLSTEEVERVIRDFADAASNAVEAGFDGVEIHGANGYLHEQFLNPHVNDRSDRYSAETLENRIRFTLDVIDACIERIGSERVGIRLSPYGELFDMPLYDEIDQTYEQLAIEVGERNLSYVHIMNQRGAERFYFVERTNQDDDFFVLLKKMKAHLPRTALILAGGLTPVRAERLITQGYIDLAAFGKNFISNPDLVARFKNGWPLAPVNADRIYAGDFTGYIDYPPFHANTSVK